MSNERETILLECLKRTIEIAEAAEPPAWKTWDVDALQELREHGPIYASGDWFGCRSDAERMRFARAVRQLQAAGLVVPWCRCGQRMTNLSLSPKGLEVARALATIEQPSNNATATGAIPQFNPDEASNAAEPPRDIGGDESFHDVGAGI